MIKNIVTLLFLLLPLCGVKAEDKFAIAKDSIADSVEVGLITCGPGDEIYEYYGHTAIRLHGIINGEQCDWVVNYGVFDFQSDNFIWRFALGHTDYIMAYEPFNYFFRHYSERGIWAKEQLLNLNDNEKKLLLALLAENAKPENRTYRYSFFYDNCATRARDKIEECIAKCDINAKIAYNPDTDKDKTLRDIVHQCSATHEWADWGQRFLLGKEADQIADREKREFCPFYLMEDFAQAKIVRNGETMPLVKETIELLPDMRGFSGMSNDNILKDATPTNIIVILLMIISIICVSEKKRGKPYYIIDSCLIVIQGIIGLLVAFLFFFSTHPTVNSNWLVIVFNPLPLIGLWWQLKGARIGKYWYYHNVSCIVLSIFLILCTFVGQKIDGITICLICILLIRNINNIVLAYRNKNTYQQQQ